MALRAERRSLLFRIAVAKRYVFTLSSCFTSALHGGPLEYFCAFEGAVAFSKLCSLPPLPAGVHAFAADVELSSVLQGSELENKEAYFAYQRSGEVDVES